MLKQWIPAAKPDKEELDKRLDAAQEELLRLQMQIKEHKLPVLVLIEGWGAAVGRALDGEDISEGALYFAARDYADSKRMRWFDEKLTLLFRHGGHEFFKE